MGPVAAGEAVAQSPTGSRRISSGSTLKHLGVAIPLMRGDRSPTEEGPPCEPLRQPPQRSFPIINPLASLPMWPNLNRESLVGKVLLANADALCAAASPLMDVEEVSLDGFEEKCVMNNYFGIGLDAKITLEFHNKREEHPEKCRSRTKNMMWFGVLGGKELLQRTYKNLEQRVQLECDGHRIALPSLQGIVVLNIPSYGGGSNFWGGNKEDDAFYAPAIDDKILEVVAVFGTVQMAASRVINLQHHRIAQCRSVRITITGDEGVPVQVDGEAWVQPPGYICIVHKNRAQTLCRNRVRQKFATFLLGTLDRRPLVVCDIDAVRVEHQAVAGAPAPLHPGKHHHHHQHSHQHRGSLTEEEAQQLTGFVELATSLVRTIKVASTSYPVVEHELFLAASQAGSAVDRLFPGGRMVAGQTQVRQQVCDLVASVRQLCQETKIFISEKLEEAKLRPDLEEKLVSGTNALEEELRKCFDLQGPTGDDEQEHKRPRSLFKLKFKRAKAATSQPVKTEPSSSISSSGGGTTDDGSGGLLPHCRGGGSRCGTPTSVEGSPDKGAAVTRWTAEEVAAWLAEIHMREYRDNFLRHDIRGTELLSLERRDLKSETPRRPSSLTWAPTLAISQELGLTKVGHIKRILQAIADMRLSTSSPGAHAHSAAKK
ncbi:hypothetical protein HPB47_026322 [Ixodes persulcatus]|uniref:Uncharacterized protein n=1 Tax=Ixodes persulcatus TaxID=34615 RepID=A0AC60PZJ2_IXOPE|nr:hypothetical protein HPB47_026322 [Ixodes persulcatus]